MTTNVQTFSHPLFGDIRVAGTFMEPLFCLVDVCSALDIKNPSRAKTALKPGGVHLMKVTTFDASLYLHIYIFTCLHIYAVLRYSLGVLPVCALKKRTKC